jgi:hypothetical protein
MWYLSTIVKRIVSLALAMALVVAPVRPSLADCMSNEPAANMAASEHNSPCDAPCKDCSPGTEKSCQGDCILATTAFVSPSDAGTFAIRSQKLEPAGVTGTLALVRPPDTPPPRLFLA